MNVNVSDYDLIFNNEYVRMEKHLCFGSIELIAYEFSIFVYNDGYVNVIH